MRNSKLKNKVNTTLNIALDKAIYAEELSKNQIAEPLVTSINKQASIARTAIETCLDSSVDTTLESLQVIVQKMDYNFYLF